MTGRTRRDREQELVAATRALFDERGMQDAPVEEIARAVGIARGLVYRSFSSKEELFVLTVTDYLDELATVLDGVPTAAVGPEEALARVVEAYARFCARYPAFLDCALSLMHRSARQLHAGVSESVWLRLGQGMARCVEHVTRVVRDGAAAGVFGDDDPDVVSNVLWTQVLGAMHLPRIGVGVREAAPGIPELFAIGVDDVVARCVAGALATARGEAAPGIDPRR